METARTRIDPFNPPINPGELKPSKRRLQAMMLFTEFETVPTRCFHRVLGYQTGKDKITELNLYGYIRIASGFRRQLDARNKEAMWEGTAKGERFLGRKFKSVGDHFSHKTHRDVIWFSFWIAPQEIPGLTLRSVGDILAHDNCPPETRLERHPSSFTVGEHTINPDHDLFGYSYPANGRTRYMYFQGFEADGGTETRTPNPDNLNASKKKNITKMVRAYRDYLVEEGYRARYGISNISIPIIAKTEADMRSIMEVVERECSEDIAEHFIFKVVPDFTEGFPPATGHMVTDDWHQVGGATLNIMDILKGDADGPARTSRPDRGTIDPDTREGEGAGYPA